MHSPFLGMVQTIIIKFVYLFFITLDFQATHSETRLKSTYNYKNTVKTNINKNQFITEKNSGAFRDFPCLTKKTKRETNEEGEGRGEIPDSM